MQSVLGIRRAALAAVLALALGAGCGARWISAKTYEVPAQADPQASYATVLEVAKAENYKLVSEDAAAKKIKLKARVDGGDAASTSFINVEVAAGSVRVSASGHLVKDGKIHRKLSDEVRSFQGKLKDRLGGGAVAAAPASTAAPEPVVDASRVPEAWSEPAYDPSVWGNGNFTCLPVKVPADHQAALSLQLSNGEKADLQLSLAYAPELCRSPAQCKVAGGGCPALGIGDPERVNRLAGRLQRGEVGAHATLLDSGKAVVTIDLSKHGSIVQAMSEIKR
jgi:hypothetical protein